MFTDHSLLDGHNNTSKVMGKCKTLFCAKYNICGKHFVECNNNRRSPLENMSNIDEWLTLHMIHAALCKLMLYIITIHKLTNKIHCFSKHCQVRDKIWYMYMDWFDSLNSNWPYTGALFMRFCFILTLLRLVIIAWESYNKTTCKDVTNVIYFRVFWIF
jgi:hypothetical protein